MTYLAAIFYVCAMLLANLLVFKFGPAISPVLAFFLIGFDLSMRDWLHVRLRAWQMLSLIATSGALTYLLNPGASKIAIASAVAFTCAAVVDWSVFSAMRGSWIRRSSASNVAGAAVDSLVFPALAFGVFMPHIVVMQFAAKVGGGLVWSFLFLKLAKLKKTASA
jgi:uncharacterized PurR-regulated membrane protein YhhQ (DUF165 family)